MKLLLTCIIIIAQLPLHAQRWAKKGNTFVYTGFASFEDKAQPPYYIKRFSIRIDSIVLAGGAKFIFLDNYFDALHPPGNPDSISIIPQPTCIAIYKDTLYRVSFSESAPKILLLNIHEAFANKLDSVFVTKEFAVKKFNAKIKSHKYDNPLVPNPDEPEFVFKRKKPFDGTTGTVAHLFAEDGRASYQTEIDYSELFFITSYTGSVFRTTHPYAIEIKLSDITHTR